MYEAATAAPKNNENLLFVATESFPLSTHFSAFFPADFYSNAVSHYIEFVIISFLLFGISVGVLRSFGANPEQMDRFHRSFGTFVWVDVWNGFVLNEVFPFFSFFRLFHFQKRITKLKIVLFCGKFIFKCTECKLLVKRPLSIDKVEMEKPIMRSKFLEFRLISWDFVLPLI